MSMTDDYHKFVKLVSKMRYAQQRYSAEKRPKMQQRAKDLEQAVDEHIKRVMEPKMFD